MSVSSNDKLSILSVVEKNKHGYLVTTAGFEPTTT